MHKILEEVLNGETQLKTSSRLVSISYKFQLGIGCKWILKKTPIISVSECV